MYETSRSDSGAHCGMCYCYQVVTNLKSTPALLATKLTSIAPIGAFMSSDATTSSSPTGSIIFVRGVSISECLLSRSAFCRAVVVEVQGSTETVRTWVALRPEVQSCRISQYFPGRNMAFSCTVARLWGGMQDVTAQQRSRWQSQSCAQRHAHRASMCALQQYYILLQRT